MDIDQVLETYAPVIHRVAASYLPPGAAREDLEQDIAIAVMKAVASFRAEASMKTYVYRIAHNCGIDAIKRRKVDGVEFDDARHRSGKPGPEQATLANERREQLAAAVRQLPLALRQPLILRLEGLAYKEIAEVLDLTTSHVGVLLHRAKKKLEDELGRT